MATSKGMPRSMQRSPYLGQIAQRTCHFTCQYSPCSCHHLQETDPRGSRWGQKLLAHPGPWEATSESRGTEESAQPEVAASAAGWLAVPVRVRRQGRWGSADPGHTAGSSHRLGVVPIGTALSSPASALPYSPPPPAPTQCPQGWPRAPLLPALNTPCPPCPAKRPEVTAALETRLPARRWSRGSSPVGGRGGRSGLPLGRGWGTHGHLRGPSCSASHPLLLAV